MITVTVSVTQDQLEGAVPQTTVWTHRETIHARQEEFMADATQYAVVRAAAQVVGYLRAHVQQRDGARTAGAASDLVDQLMARPQ